jgi:hypothetical protein
MIIITSRFESRLNDLKMKRNTLERSYTLYTLIWKLLTKCYYCYYSVQNLLSSILISKNLKIKIYKTVILPVVLYGCETWSLTLEEEHTLRVFENRVLRRIFGPKREEDGSWRKLHNDELHSLYSSLNIVRMIKSRKVRWAGHVAWGRGEVLTRFWLGGPKVRDHWEDLGLDGRITSRWTLGR